MIVFVILITTPVEHFLNGIDAFINKENAILISIIKIQHPQRITEYFDGVIQ